MNPLASSIFSTNKYPLFYDNAFSYVYFVRFNSALYI